jgi:hypothetical protein
MEARDLTLDEKRKRKHRGGGRAYRRAVGGYVYLAYW